MHSFSTHSSSPALAHINNQGATFSYVERQGAHSACMHACVRMCMHIGGWHAPSWRAGGAFRRSFAQALHVAQPRRTQ
eukprot:6186447-Pleurochrysis_carterae.AAC.1